MNNVLIVDDEELIRDGISSGINWLQLGCNPPFSAENGLEAMDVLSSNEIDIVITDIKMPGMNGLELARWIGENRKDAGVVILSGYDDFKFAQSALSYGVEEYLLKPTKLEELEKTIVKIQKKFEEKHKEHTLSNKSREIIEKSIGLSNLESYLFNRVQNAHTALYTDGMPDITACYHRMAVFKLFNSILDQYNDRHYVTDFVRELEALLNCFGFKKGIYHIIKSENDEILLYFYTIGASLTRSDLLEATDSFLSGLSGSWSGLAPFTVFKGISDIGDQVECLKDLYHCAAINCDRENQRWSYKIKDPKENEISRLLSGGEMKKNIESKNLRALCQDVAAFFSCIGDNSLNVIKSYAIELVGSMVSQLNVNICDPNINLHKAYERIIKSIDKNGVTENVFDSLKKLSLNHTVKTPENLPSIKLEEMLLEYVKGNFSKDLTLEQVATHFYISPGHVSRLIKKSCNMTFLDMLTGIRIENARVLLKNPKYKAYEVGGMVGFKDAKYFSQVFKKYTGLKPSEYKWGECCD